MANIVDKIEHILGRAFDFREVEIVDHNDGNGPQIVSWNVSGVNQPTQSELDAVTDATAEATLHLRQLRGIRNKKLANTDWMATQDRTMTQAEKDYRQGLRDITNSYSNTSHVVWPTFP